MALNTWTGVGRFTQDPELRYTPNGKAVCNFTLAVQREYVDQQTGERGADFIQVVVWGPFAEVVANHKHKGDRVSVMGRLETRSYETEKDGVAFNVYVTEVNADHVGFLDNAGDGNIQQSQNQGNQPNQSNNRNQGNNRNQARNVNRQPARSGGGRNNRGR